VGLKKGNWTKRRLSLQLTYPQSNRRDERRATLRITDEASSLVILEAELDGQQVLDLIANASVYVDAGMLDDLSRVGMEMQHESVGLGHSDEDGRSWTEERLAAFAELWRIDNKLDTVEVSRVGGAGGYRVTGRRWVPVEREDESDIPSG
jgi:hypothetical protein